MKKGLTLLEVVFALFVIAVSVASSLLVMAKLTGGSAKQTENKALSIAFAAAVAQYATDAINDIDFPPITTIDGLTLYDDSTKIIPVTNPEYSYTVGFYTYSNSLVDWSGVSPTYSGTSDDFTGDPMWNILKVKIKVFEGNSDKLLLTAYTYKIRNERF